jgi:hypothetical protein
MASEKRKKKIFYFFYGRTTEIVQKASNFPVPYKNERNDEKINLMELRMNNSLSHTSFQLETRQFLMATNWKVVKE